MTRGFGQGRKLVFESLERRNLLAFNPTGIEQELMQLLNRMRNDPQGELGRLVDRLNPIHSPFPEVNNALQFYNVNGTVLSQQWQTLTPTAPVAWNEKLWNAALGHSQEMIRQRNQQHQLPGEPDPNQRMLNAGYFSQAWGESIAARCTTVIECHASFAIDWGPGATGIQNPPGHRLLMTSHLYRDAGLAVIPHTRTDPQDVGPLVVTKDLAVEFDPGNGYITGAVFFDQNGSGWYENSEGLGGATITVQGTGGTFQGTSMTAGGYQVRVPPGTYTVTASGGGLREPLIQANVVVATNNVWVNFRQENVALPADRLEPNNDFAAATMVAAGDQVLDNLSIHLPDNADYFRWTALGSGQATVRLSFQHQNGNLALTVYNAQQQLVQNSDGGGNQETVNWTVTAGSSWYVVVTGPQRSVNANYSLSFDGPGGASPSAVDDKTATNLATPIVIELLANDSDADGDLAPDSVVITQAPTNGNLTHNRQTGAVTYSPNTGFAGVERFKYTVKDTTNLVSREATVVLGVVDYAGNPWRNPNGSTDVDGNGATSPQDALVIINRLNSLGDGPLPPNPTGPNSPPPFLDPSGDNYLSTNDVLRIVNQLLRGTGEGEFVESAADAGLSLNVILAPINPSSWDAGSGLPPDSEVTGALNASMAEDAGPAPVGLPAMANRATWDAPASADRLVVFADWLDDDDVRSCELLELLPALAWRM